jgi:hypothetical protein
VAEEMLADIDKETVDFVANFDNSTEDLRCFRTAHSESLDQWFRRHRGRHGHQDSTA